MATISELISAYNSADKSTISAETVSSVGKWITRMVNTFGLNGPASFSSDTIGWSGISIPDEARPYVYPLSSRRDELRQKARSQTLSVEDIKNSGSRQIQHGDEVEPYAQIATNFEADLHALAASSTLSKDVLQLCDRLRDVDLWDHGIYLEDRDGNQPALVRPVTKELFTARQEKEEKERMKLKAKEDREKDAAAKADKGRLSQLDMFRTSEYSAWDDEGVPLRDALGEEVTKSRTKKLRKDWERQKKLHDAWRLSNS